MGCDGVTSFKWFMMSCLFVFYIKAYYRIQDMISHEIANKTSNIIQWFIFNKICLNMDQNLNHYVIIAHGWPTSW
jgi:hypothetical protein